MATGPGPLSTLRERLPGVLAPAHLKLGVRATVAGLVAYALATALSLPNGYWAVLTAVLVVQSTIGASLSVARDRALGTVVGGVVGVVAAMAAGESRPLTFLALGLSLLLTATLSARSPAFKLAPVTVVIVLLADPSHHEPWLSALHRVFEIGVGGIVAMACAVLILPERAVFRLFPHCAKALRDCARLMEIGKDGLLGRGLDPGELDRLNGAAREALRAASARIAEARAERAGGFSGHADPAPVVRNCRRLWHSVIILLRVADRPLDEDLRDRVAPALEAAVGALVALIEAVADRLDERPESDFDARAAAAGAAVTALEGEVERLNASGALDLARAEALTALFSAVSACGHVRENAEDVATLYREAVAPEGEAA